MESRLDYPTESKGLSTEKLVSELKGMIQNMQHKAVEGAKATDKAVRDHPYQTIGLAFGLGLLIGFLVRRK